jgi:hypothetical protein
MTSLIAIVENSLKLLGAYPNAKFCVADGKPAAGTGTGPDSITKWTLSYYNGLHSHVVIVYDNGTFGQPQLINWGLFGNRIIDVPWSIDLADAIQRMRKAGFNNPFYEVVLLFPLGPGADEALYLFFIDQAGDQRITVGATTGKVHGPH